MLKQINQPLTILKGPTYTARLRELCDGELPIQPLEGIRYKRLLIPGVTGGEQHWSMMAFLAQGLRMRGAQVTALLCDSFLPACVQRKVDHVESACTRWCHRNSVPFAEAMNLPRRWYSEFISADEKSDCAQQARRVSPIDIPTYRWQGIKLGELITQSVESAFKVGQFSLDNPAMVASAYDFLTAAMCLYLIGARVLDELEIEKVVIENGRHVDWGVIRAVANQRGIPVDIATIGIRGTSMRFEIDRPPNPTQSIVRWEQWREEPLTKQQEHDLEAYLLRREKVAYEYCDASWHAHLTDPDEVRRQIGLPRHVQGKVFAMFPNVGFDTGQTKSSAAAFPCAAEWVIKTVQMIRSQPKHHLIIKAHPSEHHRQALDSVLASVKEHFDPPPANVHLVAPQTDLTAHSVIRLADVVLVYTSTVAAEAAALGKPVILAGGGWHAGRGIAIDVHSPSEYAQLLESILSGRCSLRSSREIGRRYAYTLFFREDIPMNHFRLNGCNITALPIESMADRGPGADPSMDSMCRGILFDEPFQNPQTM